jgi:hypothetical protein
MVLMCLYYREGNILLGFDMGGNIGLIFLISDYYEGLCVRYGGIRNRVI